MLRITPTLLLCLALPCACFAAEAPSYDVIEEEFALDTSDGVRLQGVLVYPERPEGAPLAVLVHDWTRDRDGLVHVVEALGRRGVASLVLDLRGHGRSVATTDGKMYIYARLPFSSLHLATRDISEALARLREHPKLDPQRVALLGVGHGALVTAEAGARRPDVKALVLVDPVQAVADFRPQRDLGLYGERPVLFISSAVPSRRAAAEALAQYGTGPREVWPGTSFNSLQSLLQLGMPAVDVTADWIAARLAAPSRPR